MKTVIERTDPGLWLSALIASVLGVLVGWNAFTPELSSFGEMFWFVGKQFAFPVAGLVIAFLIASKVKLDSWKRMTFPVTLFSLVLMALTLFLGEEKNGAKRWIEIPRLGQFQPAEFAKVMVVLTFALALSLFIRDMKSSKRRAYSHLVWPGAMMLVLLGLIALQKDLDTAGVVAAIGLLMMFVAGVRGKVLALVATLGLLAAAIGIVQSEMRMARVMAIFNRDDVTVQKNVGHQAAQSQEALANGGMWGVGFTQGDGKAAIPEAESDFVMATVGEEVGFVGFAIAYGAVVLVFFRMLTLSLKVRNDYCRLILVGCASWVMVQSMLNILSANGTLWTMGLPMPFLSLGGSSMLALWIAIGLCQGAVSADAREIEKEREAKRAADRDWRRNGWSRLSGA